MGARVNLKGQRFERLVVIDRAPSIKRSTFWVCKCDCGTIKQVMTQSLRRGLTRSCGCLNREQARSLPDYNRTHGMCGSPEYVTWLGILRRCRNKNDQSFARYGAVGKTCGFSGFDEFLADIGPKPSALHQVDRIDNALGYVPGNVRWVTPSQQQRNKTTTLMVEVNGQTKCLAEWCEEYRQDYRRVWQRIKRGWPVLRALSAGV
jgi:hypothetical protein